MPQRRARQPARNSAARPPRSPISPPSQKAGWRWRHGVCNPALRYGGRPGMAAGLAAGGRAAHIRTAAHEAVDLPKVELSVVDLRVIALAGRHRKRYKTGHQRYRSVAQPGRAPRSGRGGRRFKSCHSDQSHQQLAALGFSNNQLRGQLWGQKPLAPKVRGRSDVAWPIAPDMMDNPSIESPSFTTGSRRFRTARAEAIPRHRAKENYRSEKQKAVSLGSGAGPPLATRENDHGQASASRNARWA
jgi:hypothetical protein